MKKSKTTKNVTPEHIADRVLAKYLSPDAIYTEVLDVVMEDDFRAMEDAILGDSLTNPAFMGGTTEERQREIARQEACLRVGLAIGKRLGGAR